MTAENLRRKAAGALACAVLAGAAYAAEAPEQDRKAILNMVGEYKVTFHFKETIAFDAGGERTPSEEHHSEAHEKVYLLEDRGDFISLQHLLVVNMGEEQGVVKHWRQDWQYQPRKLVVYTGKGSWEQQSVPRKEAKGQWAQTVYQVDDSPRYGGIGPWRHIGDYSYWESGEAWRPLPRRETDQFHFYEVLVGNNRQSTTPTGWLHEQDNYKLDLTDSGNRVIARETGFDTYNRVSDFDFSAADAYWEDTKELWALVRANWAHELSSRKSIHLHNDGRSLYMKNLATADKLREGEIATAQEAFEVIRENTTAALDKSANAEAAEEAPAEH